MGGPTPPVIEVSGAERNELERLVRARTTEQLVVLRARIVLAAADGLNNTQVAAALGIAAKTARQWRGRWRAVGAVPREEESVAERLADAPRSGAPPRLTADEIVRRGLADRLSPRHVARLLKSGRPAAHRFHYWLTPAADEADREEKVADICTTSREAPTRAAAGERIVSTDELTHVQALERAAPGLSLAPGRVERREFEYVLHGTLLFMINFDVVSGRVVSPSCGPTRTEADFLAHVRQTVARDPTVPRWHFVAGNLNTHCSESLVRYVAEVSGVTDDLGQKDRRGVRQSMTSRVAFPTDPSHTVVFHSTPKHASWLNQVEIWLSILVRKLLRRGSFTSVDDLRAKVLAFIDYFNRTMAKPFKWTYQGMPLHV